MASQELTCADQALLDELNRHGSARAALLVINLDDPRKGCQWTLYSEDDDTPSPIQACWDLKSQLEPAYGRYTFTVVGNLRARYLEWRNRCSNVVGLPEAVLTPQTFLEATIHPSLKER